MLTLVAMAVPGVVLGIGYIFVWNQRWLAKIGLHLYGKPSILVLASVASVIPLINRVLVGGLLGAGNQFNLAILLSGSGENCMVALGDAALQGKFFGGETFERETRVKLKFRPEDCEWTEVRGQDTFPAQIILSTFEGDVYRIKARTAAGEEFCLLHPEYLEEGRRGYVHIPEEKLYVYV